MRQTARHFGLGDLLILVAACGVAFVGLRVLWRHHVDGPGVASRWQVSATRFLVAATLSACATPLTVACLAFRLRRPRPPWRRVAIQPGTAAGLAFLVILAARALELAAALAAPDLYGLGPKLTIGNVVPLRFSESSHLALVRTLDRGGGIGSIEAFACHGTLVASLAWPCGSAVAAVWLVLALSGRWRPERSWIDRLGRALGLTWVVTSVVASLPV